MSRFSASQQGEGERKSSRVHKVSKQSCCWTDSGNKETCLYPKTALASLRRFCKGNRSLLPHPSHQS
ncbi:hypothetical protein Q8A67_024361 [Cirrhinus molitorella]|uniref:Uncharacterized protein n=1 Tax=Cirrhinus molitorella TaxID=172907 RepID=A0AA88P4Z3_9TELE|nr:hypothetical protein Q8A67_024361 [Cirrhinus molitorella]